MLLIVLRIFVWVDVQVYNLYDNIQCYQPKLIKWSVRECLIVYDAIEVQLRPDLGISLHTHTEYQFLCTTHFLTLYQSWSFLSHLLNGQNIQIKKKMKTLTGF